MPVGITKSLVDRAQKKRSLNVIGVDNQTNKQVSFEIQGPPEDTKPKKCFGVFGKDEDYRSNRIIEEKEESYAVIQVVKRAQLKNKKDVLKYSEQSNLIPPFTKFFLQQASYASQEKYQIIETFGDFKVFFYDKRPVIKQYSGFLLNTKNHEWLNDFEYIYENYLRGTKSVEKGAITYLTFDNVILEGYILMASFNIGAVENSGVPFSFQMVITDKIPINYNPSQYRNRELDSNRNKTEAKRNYDKTSKSAKNLIKKSMSDKKYSGVDSQHSLPVTKMFSEL